MLPEVCERGLAVVRPAVEYVSEQVRMQRPQTPNNTATPTLFPVLAEFFM
jgi:hypothetical protein